jgi:hypothetical protein
MWSAFVTGFATKATELIEERDKEIQDNLKVQLSEMYKSRQKALQTSETRRDELKKTASQLRGYGLPDAAISEIITSGDSDTIAELLQKEAVAGTLSSEKITKFLGERSGQQPSEALDSIIKRLSTPVKSTTRMPIAKEMEGAFGLPTRAGERATKEFLATTGMSQAELEATEMPEVPLTATPFDFSVFAEDEKSKGVIELENKLSDLAQGMEGKTTAEKMANAVKTDEGKKLQAQIAGRIFLEAQRKAKTEKDETLKPRSAEQIRKLVNTRLQEEIAPLQFKEITFDPNLQDFVVTIPGSDEAKRFLRMRQAVARDVFENAGLLRGNRVIDRNVADAISPFAEVDYDTLTVRGWRQVAGAPRGEESVGGPPVPVEPPAGGGGAARGAPARRPTAQPAAAAGAVPIPRKPDNTIDKEKLQNGTAYVSESGAVRIWNARINDFVKPPAK